MEDEWRTITSPKFEIRTKEEFETVLDKIAELLRELDESLVQDWGQRPYERFVRTQRMLKEVLHARDGDELKERFFPMEKRLEIVHWHQRLLAGLEELHRVRTF